jgi:hypothetical protein
MSHTFVIRFERAAGLAGLLAAPENSFRWKGAGTLRIDRDGIRFAVKRGLLWLFPLERRVAAAHLEEVYREGDALHLTFTAPETPRATVACWAEDADAAGKIVELLPTRRTVELEHSTRAPRTTRARYDRRALLLLLVIGASLSGGAWWLSRRAAPFPVPIAAPAPVTIEWKLAPPVAVIAPGVEIRRIPRDSVNFAAASRQVELFEKESAALLETYRGYREALESGAISWQVFADRLDFLQARWWTVTYRILDSDEFSALELADLRSTLLATAREWRAFLEQYAQGLRTWNPAMASDSFHELARAENLQAHARQYLQP